MPTYNKLVRDRIPQIIAATGKTCRSRILDTNEYRLALHSKLREEIEEYFKSGNDQEALEELADILEIIRALTEEHGASWENLENMRMDKAEKRGGFKGKVYLIDVDDN